MDFKLLNVQSYCQIRFECGDDAALGWGADELVIVHYSENLGIRRVFHVKTDAEIFGVTPDLLYDGTSVEPGVRFTRSTSSTGEVGWRVADRTAIVLVGKSGIGFATSAPSHSKSDLLTHIPHVFREALQAHDRMQYLLKGLK